MFVLAARRLDPGSRLTRSAGGVPQPAVNNLLGSAAVNTLLLAAMDAVVGRDAGAGQLRKR